MSGTLLYDITEIKNRISDNLEDLEPFHMPLQPMQFVDKVFVICGEYIKIMKNRYQVNNEKPIIHISEILKYLL